MQIDKLMHAAIGAVAFALLMACQVQPLAAFLAVCGLALGKELYDLAHRTKHTPDALDALATIAPAGLLWLLVVPNL